MSQWPEGHQYRVARVLPVNRRLEGRQYGAAKVLSVGEELECNLTVIHCDGIHSMLVQLVLTKRG